MTTVGVAVERDARDRRLGLLHFARAGLRVEGADLAD